MYALHVHILSTGGTTYILCSPLPHITRPRSGALRRVTGCGGQDPDPEIHPTLVPFSDALNRDGLSLKPMPFLHPSGGSQDGPQAVASVYDMLS